MKFLYNRYGSQNFLFEARLSLHALDCDKAEKQSVSMFLICKAALRKSAQMKFSTSFLLPVAIIKITNLRQISDENRTTGVIFSTEVKFEMPVIKWISDFLLIQQTKLDPVSSFT